MHADSITNRRASACIFGRNFFFRPARAVERGSRTVTFFHHGAGASTLANFQTTGQTMIEHHWSMQSQAITV
jgi:hypothetical protein